MRHSQARLSPSRGACTVAASTTAQQTAGMHQMPHPGSAYCWGGMSLHWTCLQSSCAGCTTTPMRTITATRLANLHILHGSLLPRPASTIGVPTQPTGAHHTWQQQPIWQVSQPPRLLRSKILGVPLAMDKMEGPSSILTFLRIEIDTVVGVVHLPTDKLQCLLSTVEAWLHRKSCTRKELESLIGMLQHACMTVICNIIFM